MHCFSFLQFSWQWFIPMVSNTVDMRRAFHYNVISVCLWTVLCFPFWHPCDISVYLCQVFVLILFFCYLGLTSKHKGRYRQNVSDLLDPKSPLHLTADRSLQTGVRDTPTELRLATARESINESYDKMKRNMALRAEGKQESTTCTWCISVLEGC